MFFIPRVCEKISSMRICFSANTELITLGVQNEYVLSGFKRLIAENKYDDGEGILCSKIWIHSNLPEEIKVKVNKFGGHYAQNSEGYAIETGEEISIWGESEAALIFALSTLQQLSDFGELYSMFLYDYPRSSFRGYKVFVPGRSQIEQFKRIIDLLVYYKFNTVMIEIGGAMEYKRHPEINEKWEEYCNYLSEFPGKCRYHTFKYNYVRDSIHLENGRGSYLTQEEMKELVDYCRARRIEIIPEIPSYSHSDYLLCAHPELRELKRANLYADTYCPSNPDTYNLLFDVIDEVIEVFEPKRIHIGHDELFLMGQCEECRKKSPVELYVEDITKIHNYLASKNIETIMWCDGLLNIVDERGDRRNGAGYNQPGEWDFVPPLYESIDRLPKDIMMMHWLYVFGEQYDQELWKRGYKLVYGNLSYSFQHWKERTEKYHFEGGLVSNWGSLETEYLQRNNQLFTLLHYAHVFWTEGFAEEQKGDVFKRVAEENYRYFNKHFDKQIQNVIEIIHTTDYSKPFQVSYDGDCDEERANKLGDYVVLYEDGTTAKLPVIYGKNIASGYSNKMSSSVAQITCHARIIEEDKLYYKCVYENPYPDKCVIGVGFLKQCAKEFQINIKNIKFF